MKKPKLQAKRGGAKSKKPSKKPPPTPARAAQVSRIRLDDVGDVRRELSKTYRLARSGFLGMESASKLTYILLILSKLIETESFESRLTALEKEAEADGNDGNHP